MNIEIQPEPQVNFALTTFKIIPTKYVRFVKYTIFLYKLPI